MGRQQHDTSIIDPVYHQPQLYLFDAKHTASDSSITYRSNDVEMRQVIEDVR
jgi:hypothetical protein